MEKFEAREDTNHPNHFAVCRVYGWPKVVMDCLPTLNAAEAIANALNAATLAGYNFAREEVSDALMSLLQKPD